ncbi:hypothetical protein [Amycolatopsis sp. cg9]|uniref:hypothetical protein n=1 Tax=Amycolatopsis sp. cg9 TaxID=3238801 RepID=UPI003526BE7E
MRRFTRTTAALALAMILSSVTAGVAADPAAAACPGKGTRFVTPITGQRVYLVGPGRSGAAVLLEIPDSYAYLSLWGTWDGIITRPRPLDCWNGSAVLHDPILVKAPDGKVYIYDSNEAVEGYSNGFRWIVDWNTFANVYHFDPAKIVNVSYQYLGTPGAPWT